MNEKKKTPVMVNAYINHTHLSDCSKHFITLWFYDIIKKGYPRHTTLSVSQDTPSIWCSDLLLVTCSKSNMILKGEELKKVVSDRGWTLLDCESCKSCYSRVLKWHMKLELSTKVSLYTYIHNFKKSPQTQFFCESILYYCVTGFIQHLSRSFMQLKVFHGWLNVLKTLMENVCRWQRLTHKTHVRV